VVVHGFDVGLGSPRPLFRFSLLFRKPGLTKSACSSRGNRARSVVALVRNLDPLKAMSAKRNWFPKFWRPVRTSNSEYQPLGFGNLVRIDRLLERYYGVE
jgi:hypothetical protein